MMEHMYNMLCFQVNEKINHLMKCFDMDDCGHKCFGNLFETKFSTKSELNPEKIANLVSEAIKGGAVVIILNGTLLHMDKRYLMFSDGNKWLTQDDFRSLCNDEVSEN